jgi:hypothetical protein
VPLSADGVGLGEPGLELVVDVGGLRELQAVDVVAGLEVLDGQARVIDTSWR